MAFAGMKLIASAALIVAGCRPDSTATVVSSRTNAAHWQSLVNHRDQLKISNKSLVTTSLTNVRPSGTIGSDACIDCHKSQYESYLATSHSRSTRRISAGDGSKPPVDFEHSPTGRLYQVMVSDDSMTHREFIRDHHKEIIAKNEAEMSFEVGSGDHAHSYLFERNGFLIQSPLTWYASIRRWGLSPGFDPATQATFDRTVSTKCVFCHVGSVRTTGNQLEQFAIAELTIGCERCHGAGSNHVAIQSNGANRTVGATEDDIVNPKRLSRTLGESICSQCHLQGLAAVSPYAVSRWDFRPGQPLSEVVTEYQLRGVPSEFRIVGHTEQMHASGCYQKSETLTCSTCHNPHAHRIHEPAKVRHDEVCAACHDNDHCGVSLDVRVSTQGNRCEVCHMPRRDTNVPHAALHDHRIAVHAQSYRLASMGVPEQIIQSETSKPNEVPQLVAVVNNAPLPDWQQRRSWALAMHSLAFSNRLPTQMLSDFTRAQTTLLELVRSGHDDPAIEVSLSKDYLAANQIEAARGLALRAASRSVAGDPEHLAAADVLAELALLDQDNQAALRWYRQLIQYRRVSGDHVMLAVCENNAGNPSAAIVALETALQIDPTLLFAHETMAMILEGVGEYERAAAHRVAIATIRAAGSLVPNDSSK